MLGALKKFGSLIVGVIGVSATAYTQFVEPVAHLLPEKTRAAVAVAGSVIAWLAASPLLRKKEEQKALAQ